MIVSQAAFIWIVTAMTAGLCTFWGVREVILLRRYWATRKGEHRDHVFGSLVGLAMSIFGIVGCFKFHLGF